MLERGLALLRAPGNELSFAVRAALRWSRGDAVLANEGKADVFADRPTAARRDLEARAAALTRRFDLAALRDRSTVVAWTANLALLENLERLGAGRVVPTSADGLVRAIDIGAGDFHYATALHRWLAADGARPPRGVVLRGLEVDGHGIYRDGHSRADHARAHAALAARSGDVVRYEVADATRLRLPGQDVVTMLFPFLAAYPVLRWGLPLSRFRPRRVVRAAVAALRPGGWLVVANQTGDEFARLRDLLRGAPVELQCTAPFASDIVPWAARTADRIGSLWRRIDLQNGVMPG